MFCGGAAYVSSRLTEVGANEIVSRGECDAVRGEAPAFHSWINSLISKMAKRPSAGPLILKLRRTIKSDKVASLARRQHMFNAVVVEVFTSEYVFLRVMYIFTILLF